MMRMGFDMNINSKINENLEEKNIPYQARYPFNSDQFFSSSSSTFILNLNSIITNKLNLLSFFFSLY